MCISYCLSKHVWWKNKIKHLKCSLIWKVRSNKNKHYKINLKFLHSYSILEQSWTNEIKKSISMHQSSALFKLSWMFDSVQWIIFLASVDIKYFKCSLEKNYAAALIKDYLVTFNGRFIALCSKRCPVLLGFLHGGSAVSIEVVLGVCLLWRGSVHILTVTLVRTAAAVWGSPTVSAPVGLAQWQISAVPLTVALQNRNQ